MYISVFSVYCIVQSFILCIIRLMIYPFLFFLFVILLVAKISWNLLCRNLYFCNLKTYYELPGIIRPLFSCFVLSIDYIRLLPFFFIPLNFVIIVIIVIIVEIVLVVVIVIVISSSIGLFLIVSRLFVAVLITLLHRPLCPSMITVLYVIPPIS